MPAICFQQPDGTVQLVDARVGESVMSAALEASVDGIVAECGGNAMCATCHVFVHECDLDRLPAMQDTEDEMLDGTAVPRTAASRLSCQLPVTDALDALMVTVPDMQQ